MSHVLGLHNEATDEEYHSAQAFCAHNPVEAPRLLPSEVVDRVNAEGCKAWTMEWPRSSRFSGHIQDGGEKGAAFVTKVVTDKKCQDVCLFSNLPILAGLYEIQGKTGVYYEVHVEKMKGIVALGTCCLPACYRKLRIAQARRVVLTQIGDSQGGIEDQQGCTSTTCANSGRIPTAVVISPQSSLLSRKEITSAAVTNSSARRSSSREMANAYPTLSTACTTHARARMCTLR